jgi:hypothetical protein
LPLLLLSVQPFVREVSCTSPGTETTRSAATRPGASVTEVHGDVVVMRTSSRAIVAALDALCTDEKGAAPTSNARTNDAICWGMTLFRGGVLLELSAGTCLVLSLMAP